LSWVGYSDEEIDKLGNLAELTVQEMKDHISKKSAQALGGPQKIVPLHEVKKWITEGWLFVQALPGNEAVMRLPSPLLSGLLPLGVEEFYPDLALGEAFSEGKVVGLQEDKLAKDTG
jgi:hypothetical protein